MRVFKKYNGNFVDTCYNYFHSIKWTNVCVFKAIIRFVDVLQIALECKSVYILLNNVLKASTI